MTREEFERLKRRFGAEISAWPAPFRQEALTFLAPRGVGPDPTEDALLDRLILEAAGMATDEEALKRRVHESIARSRGRFSRFVPPMPAWRLPLASAGLAGVLVAAGVAGYFLAGPDRGRIDDLLLALATGETLVGDVGEDPAGASAEDLL